VVLGQFACGLYFIPSNLLFLRHRTRVIPLVTGAAAAVNIVLNLLFVPRFGYVAAAWTTFGAYVLMFAMASAAAARAITVHYEWRRIAVIGGALAATVALGWMLADVPGAGGVLLRVAAVGAFPAVLWLAGFAGPGERAAIVRARGALAVWALSGRRAP
jgi:O-antigen/teichoic acid export membrane protein